MKLNRLAATAVAASLMFLVGCSGNGDNGENSAEDTVVSDPTETFESADVDPVQAESVIEATEDPGLNVEWTMYGASVAPISGDAVIHVSMKNLNDVAVPPDAIEGPTLELGGESISLVDDDTSGIESGLDLPLGAGATTNLRYAFDTATWNLTDAEFQIGNVIFEGNLNF